jgi:N6-L-threonylcarbamoyladenine synthase
MSGKNVIILGIESSCDETSAAVIKDNKLLANIIANQEVHKGYGGVVPELASREHQKNIVPVVHAAIAKAGVNKKDISAIAYTQGPGLLGSLLVGGSFAKALSMSLNIPLIEVNHMQAHVLAHFIDKENEQNEKPEFPFLCLTVSGGHTQIVLVKDYLDMEIVGETIDDAAGEAFDKVAKILQLPYPGGPLVDKLAKDGNPFAFSFPKPNVCELEFSFSGLKTSVLYFLRKEVEKNPQFVTENINDICASVQFTIVSILMDKLQVAIDKYKVTSIAIAGGVSANSSLRSEVLKLAEKNNIKAFIPPFEYCTDNAAMIAQVGCYKFLRDNYANLNSSPKARMKFSE